MTTPTSIAAATLDAFSDRLERIELKLSGRITQPDALEPSKDTRTRSKPTVIEQLAKVQKSIQDLLARSECSRDWLMLRPYLHDGRHKELLRGPDASEVNPQALTAQLITLTSAANLYKATASRLSAIQDQTIPSTEQNCALISQGPRLQVMLAEQRELEIQVSGLRRRTAELLEDLHGSKLKEAEEWANWERRLGLIEKHISRATKAAD